MIFLPNPKRVIYDRIWQNFGVKLDSSLPVLFRTFWSFAQGTVEKLLLQQCLLFSALCSAALCVSTRAKLASARCRSWRLDFFNSRAASSASHSSPWFSLVTPFRAYLHFYIHICMFMISYFVSGKHTKVHAPESFLASPLNFSLFLTIVVQHCGPTTLGGLHHSRDLFAREVQLWKVRFQGNGGLGSELCRTFFRS